MEKKQRQRKKGGGRKLADGRMSRRVLKRHILKWFKYEYEFSVKRFIRKYNISRQTYYRFLASNPTFRDWVYAKRKEIIKIRKDMMMNMCIWLRDNPDKNMTDYFLRDIANINTHIVIPNYEINLSTDAEKSLL